MKKHYIVELCVNCEGIDSEDERIYERTNSVCPKCGGCECVILEIDPDCLRKRSINDDQE